LDRVLAILEQQPATLPHPEETIDLRDVLEPEAVAISLDYDTYNAKEIIDRAPSLESWQRQALAEYETTHANRKTVLEALRAG